MLSFRRDLIINITGSAVNTIAFMWTLRACGSQLDPAALGLYLLVRRIAETGSNLVQAGTPPTLRRYVAMESSPAHQLAYLYSALSITGVTIAATLLLGALAPSALAGLLFGNESDQPAHVLMLTAGFTISLVVNNLAVSLLSAQGRFFTLTVVTFLNTVAWLAVALQLNPDRDSILPLLGWHALATTLVSLVVLGLGVLRLSRIAETAELHTEFGPFLKYGAPRVLSPFLDAMLVALGPWLLRSDLQTAAHLAMALMLLRVGQTLVTPAATVIGTVVARTQGAGNAEATAATLRLTAGVLTALSLAGFAVLWPWVDTLVELWLGATPLAAGVTACGSGLLLAMVPFTIFQGLKEPIEMLSTRPLTLFGTALALAVLAGSAFSLSPAIGLGRAVTAAYVAAYATLALCAIYFLRNQLRTTRYYGLPRLLFASSFVVAVNLASAHLASSLTLYSRLAIAGAAGLCSLSVAIWLVACWRPSGLMRECRAVLSAPTKEN